MEIYRIINTINNKGYIGQTIKPFKKRWTEHKSRAKRMADNYHFHNAIRKYGTEYWTFETLEILDPSESLELLNLREKYWVDFYDTFKNGYNSDTGGGNDKIMSEESKEKISKNHSYFWKGKTLSQEHKEKISKSNKGKNCGEKNGMFGKPFSEEHRQKLKDAWTLRKQNFTHPMQNQKHSE